MKKKYQNYINVDHSFDRLTMLGVFALIIVIAGTFGFLYEYIFRLNYENQALEMLTLKTDLEKKYYDRMEKVNLEQSSYMHDL